MTLHDAIDQDVFKIDDNEYTDADLQAMSLDDLETLRVRINKKISGISAIIKEKQIEYANGGEGWTKEQFRRHRSAMSINQRVLSYVNSLIKKHRISGRTTSDYFMEQAKAYLPLDVYDRILSRAREKTEIREGN